MAASGPMVVHTPQGIEVKGRRRLGDASVFEAMLEELTNVIQQKEGTVISDLDVSQNQISFEHFEALFSALGTNNARVQRFRMFGCATLNDEVMRVFSDYLRLLSTETAPTEMHLSDCAVTAEGWNYLMSAIEETELYPVQSPNSQRSAPLYLRLENNYIAEDAIKEKFDAGIVRPFRKQDQGHRPGAEGSIKVNLVVRNDGTVQQKQGDPPSPEEASAPKQVWDKYSEQQQQQQQPWGQQPWGQQPWGAAKGAKGYGGGKGGAWGGDAARWNQGAAAPAALTQGGVIRPQPQMIRPRIAAVGGAAAGRGWNLAAPTNNGYFSGAAAKGAGKAAPVAVARIWPGGNAGTAVDRSRTPVARSPMQPAAPPPPKKNGGLPHPWEEHYSDEYQIPYFWNAETGDSAWEKPTA